MLKKQNYPELETQQKQHDFFVSEIATLRAKMNSSPAKASSTLQFMRDWFLNHILTEDKKYGEYLEQLSTPDKQQKAAERLSMRKLPVYMP